MHSRLLCFRGFQALPRPDLEKQCQARDLTNDNRGPSPALCFAEPNPGTGDGSLPGAWFDSWSVNQSCCSCKTRRLRTCQLCIPRHSNICSALFRIIGSQRCLAVCWEQLRVMFKISRLRNFKDQHSATPGDRPADTLVVRTKLAGWGA